MKNAYLNTTQIHDNTNNIGIWLKPNIQGLESPSIRLPSFDRPNVDGAFVPNQLYGGRAITLEGKVSGGGSLTTYRTLRRTLENAARIYRPGGILTPITFKFKTMDDLELQADVYVQNIKFPDILMGGGNFALNLFAPDTRLLSQELKVEQINIFQGGGMAIPMGIPMDMSTGGSAESMIDNEGDFGSQPFFIIRGTIDDPTVSNQTTGDSFSIDYTLTSSNERIEVDVATRTVLYFATDVATGVNIRDKFTGDWFEIASGQNSIKLVVADVTDTGYLIIKWRDAYLGV